MHTYLRDAMGTQMLGLHVWRDQAALMPMAHDDVCIMLPPWAGAFIAVVDQRGIPVTKRTAPKRHWIAWAR